MTLVTIPNGVIKIVVGCPVIRVGNGLLTNNSRQIIIIFWHYNTSTAFSMIHVVEILIWKEQWRKVEEEK